jgi:hypothetical protein
MSRIPNTALYLVRYLTIVLLCRASLICGKLPAEEMRDLRSKLTKQMDVLNHMLELDLVVRYRHLELFCFGGSVSDPESEIIESGSGSRILGGLPPIRIQGHFLIKNCNLGLS